MSNNKQTAVEWLAKEISNQLGTNSLLEELFEQAKVMHKEEQNRFNYFLQKEIELGISDKATIERIEWYYKNYFTNNEQ